jgi:hypothetical protein
MNQAFIRVVAAALIVTQLSGCGLILYPERENQARTGRIDPTVAILDGVGCLLFLIPGLVAFAVDFHEGTIYLPPGEHASGEWRPVAMAGTPLTPEAIERTVREQTGAEVSLDDPRLHAWRVNDATALPVAGMP